MASEARQRMVESAVVLLAKQGYRATSFEAVLERSKAPRGSIYHHFPGGKDEMISAAMDLAGKRAMAVLETFAGKSAPEMVDGFMGMWRQVLEASDLEAGCSVLAITVSAETPELRLRAGDIFRAWRGRLAELLEESGVERRSATSFAATVVSAAEGAVALSRAERDTSAFDDVARNLHDFAEGLAAAGQD